MAQPKCSECEYNIDMHCTNTKRRWNTISSRITNSPNWCYFKKKARRNRHASPRALLVKELDKLWMLAIRLRAGGCCEITGKPDGEGRGHINNAHHLIGRSNFRTRWMLENGVYVSPGKHTLNADSAHKDPANFLKVMIEKRGQKWYDDLQHEAFMFGGGVHHTDQDLLEIKATLEKEIAKWTS